MIDSKNLGAAERAPSHSVGAGEYRILRGRVLGGELVQDDRAMHISAFPADEGRIFRGDANPNGSRRPAGPRGTPIARPSRRRMGFLGGREKENGALPGRTSRIHGGPPTGTWKITIGMRRKIEGRLNWQE